MHSIATQSEMINKTTRVFRQISIECPKTITSAITLANHNDADNQSNQSKLEVNPCCRREAREKESEPVTIGFGFTSDWLKKWCEFFKPIVCRSIANQSLFDTQVKTALLQ